MNSSCDRCEGKSAYGCSFSAVLGYENHKKIINYLNSGLGSCPGFMEKPEPQTAVISTSTGTQIDLLNPKVEDIRLADISCALAHLNRFTGHAKCYSVAKHSLNVERAVTKVNPGNVVLSLQALFHDAAEAYVGDISSPLKRVLGQKWYDIESGLHKVICEKFGIPVEIPEEVRDIDARILDVEGYLYVPKFKGRGGLCVPVEDIGLVAPRVAYSVEMHAMANLVFLSRAQELLRLHDYEGTR